MDETGLDLREFLGLLRRQFRLIGITFGVTIVAIGLATIALTPVYTATALIIVDPSGKDLLDPDSQIGNGYSDNARVESEVELVRADTVLVQVIRQLQLVSDSEFGANAGWMPRLLTWLHLRDGSTATENEALGQVLNRLRSATSVQRRGLTYLIAVQARSQSPARAAQLANAITQTYIDQQLASKVANVLASGEVLQARLDATQQTIATGGTSFDQFLASAIPSITGATGNGDIASLFAQLSQITKARAQSQETAAIIQQAIASGNWSEIANSAASKAIKDLERQRSEIAGSASALAAIDARLNQAATAELAALQAIITDGHTRENALRATLGTLVLGSNLPPALLAPITALTQSAALARTQYDTLLARSQELSAQADLQLADSRIASPALVPVTPSFPNPLLFLLLGTVAAAGIGIGLALLYEHVIGGFNSEEQAEAVLRIKVASSLPRSKAGSLSQSSPAELIVTAPISAFAESVRRVRPSLERAARPGAVAGQGMVIMVSSAAPGEGKTTAALSLTRSYAVSGKSTLLIDCDLRTPSVLRQIGSEPPVGFLDYLTAEAGDAINIQAITAKDPLSTATVIAGAHRSSIPTDQLIAGTAFAQLIGAARRSFDIVVLDTPPIGGVVDGLYLSQHADVIVFVVRYASTPQAEARKALASLNTAKAEGTPILAVLNQQDLSQHGGYGAGSAPG